MKADLRQWSFLLIFLGSSIFYWIKYKKTKEQGQFLGSLLFLIFGLLMLIDMSEKYLKQYVTGSALFIVEMLLLSVGWISMFIFKKKYRPFLIGFLLVIVGYIAFYYRSIAHSTLFG